MAVILQKSLKNIRSTYPFFNRSCYTRVNHTTALIHKTFYSSSCKFYSKFVETSSINGNGNSNGNYQSSGKHEINDNSEVLKKKRLFSVMIGSLIGFFSFSYILYKKSCMKAISEEISKETDEETKSANGFKERKIIEYENRIRQYSTPDKIFRYFATIQDINSNDIFMTPEDFVRSLTPNVLQPHDLGLDIFKQVHVKNLPVYESKNFGENSVFLFFGDKGLVNFSDYVFLLAVIGTSSRIIELAFKMFDLNGDGDVTEDEFEKVRSLFLSMSTSGSRHRDHATTGSILNNHVSSELKTYFFGKDGLKKLTVDRFIEFKMKLQKEVMLLEFQMFGSKDGVISENKFTEMLLTYAYFDKAKHSKILKKIKKMYGEGSGKNEGLLFEDYLDFYQFLLNLRDVEMALSFHTVSGQTIDKETFKQVAKSVAGVNLRDHLVDVVFSIFDENGDGHLSNKEFVAVMKDKMFRGLNKPKDTGFTRLLSAIWKCTKISVSDTLSKQ
uniref:Calcium uptake protein 1,mitochondrial n=1 Tax=Hydra vulgaris TaxID=6087 RepID=T2M6K5_HYDVU